MDKAFDVKMIADFIPTLAGYLPITLYILALSLIFGFILGVLLSLPRIYKVPILDQFARVYISFFVGRRLWFNYSLFLRNSGTFKRIWH